MLGVLFVAPLVWAVLRSFESEAAITSAPKVADFTHLTITNYQQLIGGSIHILHYVGNSLIVAVGTAVLTAVLATAAGYGFGRFRFRGRGLIFAVTLLALMIPYQAILTPAFLELNFLHLTNSLLGLVLFYSTFNLPFGVFVMRNTFSQIPAELEESARVDGAGTLTTLWRVMRPLVAPGIATTVLYAFLFAWTEFLAALTFLTQQGSVHLPGGPAQRRDRNLRDRQLRLPGRRGGDRHGSLRGPLPGASAVLRPGPDERSGKRLSRSAAGPVGWAPSREALQRARTRHARPSSCGKGRLLLVGGARWQ